jgi:hypothetical protein
MTIESFSMPYDPWSRSVALSSSNRRLSVASDSGFVGSVMTLTRSSTTGGEKCTTTLKSSSPLGRTIHKPGSTSEWLAPSPLGGEEASISSFVIVVLCR